MARRVCQQPDAADRSGSRTGSSAAVSKHPIKIDETAMIAAQLIDQDLSGRAPNHSMAAIKRETDRSGILADASPAASKQFQPLDPGIVNEAIPAFFIGRNKDGFWVARQLD
jgi:hypothetical protein